MDRLLVTGIDRVLGGNLALALADRFQVLGLYARHPLKSEEFETAPWEPGESEAFGELVHRWRPQWIVHCPALAAPSWDEDVDANLAEHEPRAAAQLVQLAEQVRARITIISSDVVFAGPRMFHEETAEATSPAPRAAQVRQLEQAAQTAGVLLVRTHAYGWAAAPQAAGFAQQAFEALSAGSLPSVDGLRHATPILATDLAEMLLRAYELRLHGLYHLSGAERTSPWGFITQLAASLGLRWPAGRCLAAASAAGWHDETSLSSRRARRALEMATPMLREGLYRFAEQATGGWRDRLTWADSRFKPHEAAA